MYKLYTTPTFERRLKSFLKKHPDLSGQIEKKLDLLLSDPFHPELKTHRLSGKLKAEEDRSLDTGFRRCDRLFVNYRLWIPDYCPRE